MATSHAQLRTPPAPLPMLVAAEPLRLDKWELARPSRTRVVLLAADLLGLSLVAGAGALFGAEVWHTVSLLPLVYAAAGLYSLLPRHSAEELRRIVLATVLAFALTGGGLGTVPCCMVAVLLLPLVRHATRSTFARHGWWGMSVVVLAPDRRRGEDMVELLEDQPELGLKPAALLYAGGSSRDPATRTRVRASLDAAGTLRRDSGLRCAVVASVDAGGEVTDALHRAGACFEHVIVVPADGGGSSLHVETAAVGDRPAFAVRHNLQRRSLRCLKRSVDSVLALAALPLAAIAGALIAILIKITSRGPVFFSQERIGRNGMPFRMLKFRTRVTDGVRVLATALRERPALRREWETHRKLQNDPRITALIGTLLRRTSLDELPQLINVLRREMNLVGPRPVLAAELLRYGREAELYRKVRPGITGLWQVSGRNDIAYEERVQLDAWYVRNWSLWLDFDILLRTAWVVIRGRGAY
jgi:Undecaprenyl-phosphate galactose phosphotransferase WbaP